MNQVLLVQLDGKLPNIALMRIAAFHRTRGDGVTLRHGGERGLWDEPWSAVYGSAIFHKTKPAVDRLRREYPEALIGGTGVNLKDTLESHGIQTTEQDYSIYPDFRQSIGFSQRGCRLNCEFCVVPGKEGKVREASTIHDIWRGDPWPREILLLDNDFFGQPHWRDRIHELQDGQFKVSFNQGINARCLTDEAAEAIASVDYRDDAMKVKRIYTAWDNRQDEERLFAGLNRLLHYGVKPAHIMVYILCGYWPGETHADRDYRRRRLREFGAIPYPMPFERTTELVAFQRWVVLAWDKYVKWDDWYGRPYKKGPDPRLPVLQESLDSSW